MELKAPLECPGQLPRLDGPVLPQSAHDQRGILGRIEGRGGVAHPQAFGMFGQSQQRQSQRLIRQASTWGGGVDSHSEILLPVPTALKRRDLWHHQEFLPRAAARR